MAQIPNKTYDVVAVGNAIVDVLARADDAFLERHGMVKGSMALIEDDVAHALYADMPPASEVSGGSAANTVAGIASFGGTVGFIGQVANDELGHVFSHDIRAAGVHFEPLRRVDSARGTARCLVLVTEDAQRTMNTYLGVSSLIEPSDIDEALVSDTQVVYCEGYLWDLPETKQALIRAMEIAHANGAKVAFTLSDSFCVDRHRAEFLDLVEHHVDILFANEAELLSLYEVDDWDTAAKHVAGHAEITCLTRSEHGSVVITADERVEVAAVAVTSLEDTTGAGDLYAAGFLYGHTHGYDLERSARLGSLAASEVISHLGARPQVALSHLAADLLA